METGEFLCSLRGEGADRVSAARSLFRPGVPVTVARAPGRLDVMGGIADYSGSLVLQLPIREATHVALQPDDEPFLRIVSTGAEEGGRSGLCELPVSHLCPGEPVPYAAARDRLTADPRSAWGAYVAGVLLVLMRELGLRLAGGARILIESDVPEGKGVSSSAALEVAVMQAAAGAFGLAVEPRELALLCRKAENEVVGAPCGVMDQMTAACGEAGHLLALLCQPAEIQGLLPVPAGVGVWGIDSGVRHSVSGADYGTVRAAAFMGYRIAADLAGLAAGPGPGPEVRVDDPLWGGYLANIPPSVWEGDIAPRVPERLTGSPFLARYGGTTDPVTRVDPAREYPVRAAAAHPVHEHHRIRLFAELLACDPSDRTLELLGELMYQSHAGYSACGLGSDATDRLVEMVRAAGPGRGLYGARITGGGSGGTVAVLGLEAAAGSVREIAAAYGEETGTRPHVFDGSSTGAASFGCRTVLLESP